MCFEQLWNAWSAQLVYHWISSWVPTTPAERGCSSRLEGNPLGTFGPWPPRNLASPTLRILHGWEEPSWTIHSLLDSKAVFPNQHGSSPLAFGSAIPQSGTASAAWDLDPERRPRRNPGLHPVSEVEEEFRCASALLSLCYLSDLRSAKPLRSAMAVKMSTRETNDSCCCEQSLNQIIIGIYIYKAI